MVRACWLALAAAACSGSWSSEPRALDVELELVPGDRIAYDVAAAATGDAFLVSWTEHRVHDGDTREEPDIFYAEAATSGVSAPVAFTPYASAQLQSQPFCGASGCGVLWGDDAVAGYPDRRIAWQLVGGGPVGDSSAAHPISTVTTHQRSQSDVAVVGDRALVAYIDASAADALWRASVLDLSAGTVARELVLPGDGWQSFFSVTAGASSFLVLYTAGAVGEKQQLYAVALDLEGGTLAGPLLLAERMPADDRRPPAAAYHDGTFLVPTLDFEIVELPRRCCPECADIEPPTCVVEDYHLYVVRLEETTWTPDDPVCLDCRTDAQPRMPLAASTADGGYFVWDENLARVTASHTPSRDEWRSLVFPDTSDAFTQREVHGLAARGADIVLVGRQGTLGSDAPSRPFVGRIVY